MSHGITTDERISRERLLAMAHEPAHIIGAASAEGVAVLRLLLHLGFTNVIVHDMRPRAELRRAFRTVHGAFARIEQDAIWEALRPVFDAGRYGDGYLTGIDDAALVSLGQGWYLDDENRRRIVERIPAAALVTSMSELYFALHRGPIAGITGTNGKSTTTALVEHLLTDAHVPFLASGNERSSKQFLPDIEEVVAGTWALLEVSNRQLLQLARSPQVAAITSLTPDHLSEHGGWDGYRDAKARLFEHQSTEDVAIVNADDPEALAVALRSPAARSGRLIRCGTGLHDSPSVTWRDGVLIAEDIPLAKGGHRDGQSIIATSRDLTLLGSHNLRNAAVAAAVAVACGADPAGIAASMRTFSGKALRLQRLDVVDGVEVWSDLKSTTPEATTAALDALAERRVVLIAGGADKGLDYRQLADLICAEGVHALVVPGTATDALERAIVERCATSEAGDGFAFERVEDLARALDRGFEIAASGDVVIVSPAAAGFWTQELHGSSSLRKLVARRANATQEVHEP